MKGDIRQHPKGYQVVIYDNLINGLDSGTSIGNKGTFDSKIDAKLFLFNLIADAEKAYRSGSGFLKI